MRILVLVAVLMLTSMAGVVQGQCPTVKCPPVPSRTVPCSPQPVHGCPTLGLTAYSVPVVSACQPAPHGCGIQVSTNVACNSHTPPCSYAIVTSNCPSNPSHGRIVYGHSSNVILSETISSNVVAGQPYAGTESGAIVYSAPVANPGLPAGNCNCGGAVQIGPSGFPGAPSQAGDVVPYNPFSLSGRVRADTGRAIPNQCEVDFLECCAYGAKGCLAAYLHCSEVTGEPLRHRVCPSATPVIDE